MTNPPAVHIDVCLAFLKKWLEGFRGYPDTEGGRRRFAECLQSNAVSVEHLEAILSTFEDYFPTVRQIHDVAWNTRAKFEPAEDTVAEWARIYGKPQAFDKHPPDALALHWTAIRDMLYYTEGPGEGKGGDGWDTARLYDLKHHAETVEFIRQQVRELGWKAMRELAASPVAFPYKNPRHGDRPSKLPVLTPVGAPLTQADIESAWQARKSTAQVDTELDGWDDPDR